MTTKKLTLSKETLRVLTSRELGMAKAGMGTTIAVETVVIALEVSVALGCSSGNSDPCTSA